MIDCIDFLKALNSVKHDYTEKRFLESMRISILFFGTPLNTRDEKTFQSALRACATIELGIHDNKWKKVDPQVLSEVIQTTSNIDPSYDVYTFFEKDASLYIKSVPWRRQGHVLIV